MTNHEEQLGPVHVGLRRDLLMTRQVIGGKPTYVAHDPITFQNHALNRLEFRIMSALVPHRSLAETFTRLVEKGTLAASDADSFYNYIVELHAKNLLNLPLAQADELFKRHTIRQQARRSGWYRSLLYFNLPLFNPDLFLDRTLRYFGWLFSKIGFAFWAILMLLVVWKCAGRFGEMFGQTSELLSISNLPIMWVALILLKVIHEFGHAYACKRWGGTVPEMGVAFIVMTPCAFVNAGSSWTLSNRWHRIAVAMAGMYIESIVAGVFALIWAGTQPGFLHDVSLNVVVLASLVTLLFNLNPLIKFDGYFVVSDMLGIVNLRQRADEFLKGWARWLTLGVGNPLPDCPRREKWILGLYAPCAFLYKCILAFSITLMVITQWTAGGMVLAALFAWVLILQPLASAASYLLRSPDTQAVRKRARYVALGAYLVLPVVVAVMPISVSVEAPGIVEPIRRVSIRAPLSGFVEEVKASHGATISAGDELCLLRNPAAKLRRIEAIGELESEEIQFDAEELRDPTLATTSRLRIAHLKARVADLDRRLSQMHLKAQISGVVVSNKPEGWLGRYVQSGEELMQLHSSQKLLRVVLTDHEVDQAHLEEGSTVEVRLANNPSRTIQGVVREIRRVASRTDVPLELTMLAGGKIYAQATDNGKARSDRPYLHVFLALPENAIHNGNSGLTARVRMPARVETLGSWLKRTVLNFYNEWKMS